MSAISSTASAPPFLCLPKNPRTLIGSFLSLEDTGQLQSTCTYFRKDISFREGLLHRKTVDLSELNRYRVGNENNGENGDGHLLSLEAQNDYIALVHTKEDVNLIGKEEFTSHWRSRFSEKSLKAIFSKSRERALQLHIAPPPPTTPPVYENRRVKTPGTFEIQDTDWESFARMCPNLTSLVLAQMNARQVNSMLKGCWKLQDLTLLNCKLDTDSYSAIHSKVARVRLLAGATLEQAKLVGTKLHAVELKGESLTDEGIAELMEKAPQLEEFHVHAGDMSKVTARAVKCVTRGNVRILTLTNCTHILDLTFTPSSSSQLRHLTLKACHAMASAHGTATLSALPRYSRLEQLTITGQSKFLSTAAEAIAACRRLTQLTVTQLKDLHFDTHILPRLAKSDSLRVLKLDGTMQVGEGREPFTNITIKTVGAFADACKSIRAMDIQGIYLGSPKEVASLQTHLSSKNISLKCDASPSTKEWLLLAKDYTDLNPERFEERAARGYIKKHMLPDEHERFCVFLRKRHPSKFLSEEASKRIYGSCSNTEVADAIRAFCLTLDKEENKQEHKGEENKGEPKTTTGTTTTSSATS